MVINSVCMSTCKDASDILSDDNFANVLQSNVKISHVNIMKPNNVYQVSYADSTLVDIQSRKRKQIYAEILEKSGTLTV